MTDEQLLRDAAKAVGYKVVAVETSAFDDDVAIAIIEIDGMWYSWAPRISDAVAFRLAVDLDIAVMRDRDELGKKASALVPREPGRGYKWVDEYWHDHPDKYAATRVAIVRAAAEIGRNMEGDQ